MEPLQIIKLTVQHSLTALAVSAIFGGSIYIYKFFYPPDSPVIWWLDKIDLMQAIIVPTALAAMFLSSLFRIVRDTVAATWKGDSNGKTHFLLA